MAKTHRLKTQEHNVWRENTPQLVNSDGESVRLITAEEERLIGVLLVRASASRQSIKQTVEVSDAASPGVKRSIEVEIIVTPTAGNLPPQRTVKVDGLDRVCARDLMKLKLFELYKCDVQIQRPNGAFLAVVRDPKLSRPSIKQGSGIAPPPANCVCRDWGNPHPGRHHPVCEHNARAPLHEQAISEVDRLVSVEQESITKHVERNLLKETLAPEKKTNVTSSILSSNDFKPEAVVIPRDVLDRFVGESRAEKILSIVDDIQAGGGIPRTREVAPADCECAAWERPEGASKDEHHLTCEHQDYWEKMNPHAQFDDVAKFYLVDLRTGKLSRQATPEEAESSLTTVDSLGMRCVTIDERLYALVDQQNKDWLRAETNQ